MEALYTAVATATHGREGRAITPDGKLDLQLAIPVEMGGSGQGTNPEQLFAAGYAACFASALGLVGRQAKIDVSDAAVTGEVGIGKQGRVSASRSRCAWSCPQRSTRPPAASWSSRPTRSAPTPTRPAATSRSSSSSSSGLRAATGRRPGEADPGGSSLRGSTPLTV